MFFWLKFLCRFLMGIVSSYQTCFAKRKIWQSFKGWQKSSNKLTMKEWPNGVSIWNTKIQLLVPLFSVWFVAWKSLMLKCLQHVSTFTQQEKNTNLFIKTVMVSHTTEQRIKFQSCYFWFFWFYFSFSACGDNGKQEDFTMCNTKPIHSFQSHHFISHLCYNKGHRLEYLENLCSFMNHLAPSFGFHKTMEMFFAFTSEANRRFKHGAPKAVLGHKIGPRVSIIAWWYFCILYFCFSCWFFVIDCEQGGVAKLSTTIMVLEVSLAQAQILFHFTNLKILWDSKQVSITSKCSDTLGKHPNLEIDGTEVAEMINALALTQEIQQRRNLRQERKGRKKRNRVQGSFNKWLMKHICLSQSAHQISLPKFIVQKIIKLCCNTKFFLCWNREDISVSKQTQPTLPNNQKEWGNLCLLTKWRYKKTKRKSQEKEKFQRVVFGFPSCFHPTTSFVFAASTKERVAK